MRWNTPQTLATIWVELKSIMLSEKVRQRKTNIINLSYMWRNRENRSVVTRGKWQEMGDTLEWFVCLHKLCFKRKKSFKIGKIKKKKKRVKNMNSSCIYSQFSSVAHSCPTLCNPMNCSTPGLSVHHQLPELTQNSHPSSR